MPTSVRKDCISNNEYNEYNGSGYDAGHAAAGWADIVFPCALELTADRDIHRLWHHLFPRYSVSGTSILPGIQADKKDRGGFR